MMRCRLAVCLLVVGLCWSVAGSGGGLETERRFYVSFSEILNWEAARSSSVALEGAWPADPAQPIGHFGPSKAGEPGKSLGGKVHRLFENVRSGAMGRTWAVMPTGQSSVGWQALDEDRSIG